VIPPHTFDLWEWMRALKHENLTIVTILTQATHPQLPRLELHKECYQQATMVLLPPNVQTPGAQNRDQTRLF
jgi:hypothetical protein